MENYIKAGSFVSDGTAKILVFRSDVDYVVVTNETQMATTTTATGFRFHWRRGQTTGVLEKHVTVVDTGGANQPGFVMTDVIAANAGFTLFNASNRTPGAAIAVTGGTDATQPVYSTGNTSTLVDGGVVRVYGTAHTNLSGLDFTVDTVVANTSFRLSNAIATAPGLIAGAAGFWRLVATDADTYKMFNPANRYIANITAAASAVVTTLVDHTYEIGDKVRLNVPAEYGMTQMNGLLATITAVTADTFTINIDSSAFTAFRFPLPAIVPFTPAEVIPVGLANTVSGYGDAIKNGDYIGLRLAAGALSPAGANLDVISYIGFKTDNQ